MAINPVQARQSGAHLPDIARRVDFPGTSRRLLFENRAARRPRHRQKREPAKA
ncbi:MAG: hypothetical protein IKC51_03670 [Myxococcaceae bacterium]|nr:hypothetical protein [Myxococcaceae bacterium]